MLPTLSAMSNNSEELERMLEGSGDKDKKETRLKIIQKFRYKDRFFR